MEYKVYTLRNFKSIPQIQKYLSQEEIFDIEVVGNILPFKANSYVVEELIEWEKALKDPIFTLTFPHKEMLKEEHYNRMAEAIRNGKNKEEIAELVKEIRKELNPNPAGQKEANVPIVDGKKVDGMQHKYKETLLIFPSHGQTCHAYCTFCFRWPQFSNMDDQKFLLNDPELIVKYLRKHPEITDVLFTGGDPMVMGINRLKEYIDPVVKANLPNIKTIRIGSKTLGYWPYRYLSDKDSQELLDYMKEIVDKGINLSFMAHFNHPNELKTEAVREAIKKIRATGAIIRTQSPLLEHINDKAEIWEEMWKEQVRLGLIPYYMFIARNTGAQHFFSVPIEKAHQIYKKAYENVSGLARTVRGPSMSTAPGKIQVLGTVGNGENKKFVLQFIQGRESEWVCQPFFAKYNEKAIWIDDLEPVDGEEFFFEN